VSKYRAVVDISQLGRRYRSWCGLTNRLEGDVQLVAFDLAHQCELWEVEGAERDAAWRTLEATIGSWPVTIYQIAPDPNPAIVWPRTSRCDYGHD
jgi:hypothetical protein